MYIFILNFYLFAVTSASIPNTPMTVNTLSSYDTHTTANVKDAETEHETEETDKNKTLNSKITAVTNAEMVERRPLDIPTQLLKEAHANNAVNKIAKDPIEYKEILSEQIPVTSGNAIIPNPHYMIPNADHVEQFIQDPAHDSAVIGNAQMAPIDANQLLNFLPNDMYQNWVREYYIPPYDATFEKHKQIAQVYYNQYTNNEVVLTPAPVIKEHHVLPFNNPNIVPIIMGQSRRDNQNENQNVQSLTDKSTFQNRAIHVQHSVPFDRNLKETSEYYIYRQHKDLNGIEARGLYVPAVRTINKKVHLEEIPMLQHEKKSQVDFMKYMDNFTLERKKTNVVLPYFIQNSALHVNKSKLNSAFSSSDSVLQRIGNHKMADVDIDNKRTEWRIIKENKANALKTKTVSDSPSTVMLSSVTDSTNDSMNPVDSFIHAFDDIDLNKLKDPKLLDVLREQTEKMYSLINQIQAKRQRQQTERTNNLMPKPTIQAERQGAPNKKTTIDVSEDLISQLDKDIEMRKRTQHMTTTKTYTTELILERTVELTIDETMVKEALKKDPYIQRILKLNNMKKKEYYSKR